MTNPAPTGKNLLKRGADPYADAAETDQRSGLIPFFFNATDWNAGGTQQHYAPCSGRIREIMAIVETPNSANASVITVGVGTETAGSLTIPSAAGTGKRFSATIADVAGVSANIVSKGAAITITADGAPSAGVVRGWVRIAADLGTPPAPVVTSNTSSGQTTSTQT